MTGMKDMDVIERVAKAIANAQFQRNYFGELSIRSDVILVSQVWKEFIPEAVAAIGVSRPKSGPAQGPSTDPIRKFWQSRGFSPRAAGCMVFLEIRNTKALAKAVSQLDDDDYFDVPNFGPKSMAEIRAFLSKRRLRVGRE